MSAPSVAPSVERINFAFSWDGRHAASLAADERLELMIHMWTCEDGFTELRELPVPPGEGTPTSLLPLDDGRILLCRTAPGPVHHFSLMGEDLGSIRCDKLRIRPSGDPAVLAVIATRTGESQGAVWRITDRVEHVCDLPGLQLVGGGPLDHEGRRYGLNRQGAVKSPVAVTVADGTVTPLFDERTEDEVLQVTCRRTGRVLVATAEEGTFHLRVDDHVPPALNAIDGAVYPLCFDDSGERLLLQVSKGVDQRIVVHDLRTGTTKQVALPLGGLCGPVAFTGTGLVLAYSTPDRPGELRTVPLGGTLPPAGPEPEVPAVLEQFPGPAGPIEAIVYGRHGWRTADRVLIALHGGPEHHWSPRFDPLFARLARDGVTVVAPNQRGSTRYGAAHQSAIHGAWGGPDLADIHHLARIVKRPGGELALYGVSYGAYLALLAAAVHPDLWSACAVVAPFLSGPKLYAEAGDGVRRLLERLDGLTEIDDEIGPRDLTVLGPRITARLMVIHGTDDPVVPVSQSRALVGALREVDFREIPGAGHNPLFDVDGTPLPDLIPRFLFPR
ncbi:alpha/beta hydrolase family protein [Rhizohabitans arisaemae]|uniref:alpha/beta hydrolase family protein n=1 Tax=Rhizohabitans arisaemae TaxID=2720610 RepID=UPI0024B1FA7D|nr:alpha/beta fold hydrolase [Rhizohabitans arisaemae]